MEAKGSKKSKGKKRRRREEVVIGDEVGSMTIGGGRTGSVQGDGGRSSRDSEGEGAALPTTLTVVSVDEAHDSQEDEGEREGEGEGEGDVSFASRQERKSRRAITYEEVTNLFLFPYVTGIAVKP